MHVAGGVPVAFARFPQSAGLAAGFADPGATVFSTLDCLPHRISAIALIPPVTAAVIFRTDMMSNTATASVAALLVRHLPQQVFVEVVVHHFGLLPITRSEEHTSEL